MNKLSSIPIAGLVTLLFVGSALSVGAQGAIQPADTGGISFSFDPTKSMAMALIYRPDVQAELKVTTGQHSEIIKVRNEIMTGNARKMREAFALLMKLPFKERAAAMQKQMGGSFGAFTMPQGELNPLVAHLLSPTQTKRLSELDLQYRGALSMGEAAVADQVKLTLNQKANVATYIRKLREAREGISKVFQSIAVPPTERPKNDIKPTSAPMEFAQTPEAMNARFVSAKVKAEETRVEMATRVINILSPDQLMRWKSLQGAGFLFQQLKSVIDAPRSPDPVDEEAKQ